MAENSSSIITAQQHIIREQKRFPGASGEFSFLLSGITLATKMIQAEVRRAGLNDVLGEHGEISVQGEIQQKLDVISNEALVHCLSARESIGVLASEENEEPMLVHKGSNEAKYAVVFDPLDGSSNIGVTQAWARLFQSCENPTRWPWTTPNNGFCNPAASKWPPDRRIRIIDHLGIQRGGWCSRLYLGPRDRSLCFESPQYDHARARKILFRERSLSRWFPLPLRRLYRPFAFGSAGEKIRLPLHWFDGGRLPSHPSQRRGFLYPPTEDNKEGKLRLLYEANPVAFLAEQAGGTAIDGGKRILDIEPTSIHQRTPLVVGSRIELADFERFVQT